MALGLCRAFVDHGGQGTAVNQVTASIRSLPKISSKPIQQAFYHSGILSQVLNLAFSSTSDFNVRAEVRYFKITLFLLLLILIFIPIGLEDMLGYHSRQRPSAGELCTATGQIRESSSSISWVTRTPKWGQFGLRNRRSFRTGLIELFYASIRCAHCCLYMPWSKYHNFVFIQCNTDHSRVISLGIYPYGCISSAVLLMVTAVVKVFSNRSNPANSDFR